MKCPPILVLLIAVLASPSRQAQAAGPDWNPPANGTHRDADVIGFLGEWFSSALFVAKMKPIVDARQFMAATEMTLGTAQKREAAMAQQWEQQAGPFFFERLAGKGLNQHDVLDFMLRMYRGSDIQQNVLAARIHHAAGIDARKRIDLASLRLAMSYIHGRLTETMWGNQFASPAQADDRSLPSSTEMRVTMGYARLGGYTPGNVRITIQDGQATIVTPGRPPMTSEVPAAADEVQHFCALFRLGDFFNVPASRPPAKCIVVDQPEETLTLTVGARSHTADCTDTQDPYLRDLIELFREVSQKQEAILEFEAAAAGGTQRSPPMAQFLRWHMPLRAQRDRASKVLNELMKHKPLHEVLFRDVRGANAPFIPLADSRTVEILVAKLNARDRLYLDAAEALGSSGDPRAIPHLLNLLAGGDHNPRIILALARLDCCAVLEEALTWQSMDEVSAEVLARIGRDDPRAVALLESSAYGWFADRHSRAEATRALARMGRLPSPTKAGLFAHVFVVALILGGIVVLVAPRAVARLLGNSPRHWLAAIAVGGILAGLGMLYLLHLQIFF